MQFLAGNLRQECVAGHAASEWSDRSCEIEARDYLGNLAAAPGVTHQIAMRDGTVFEQPAISCKQNPMLLRRDANQLV